MFKFLIIDGMSVLFRSFYAMGSNLTAPDGSPSGAIYGFLRVIFKLLEDQKATHLVVCWDLPDKTFRHEVFEQYKAHRGETPSDLLPQILKLKDEILPKFSIPAIGIPGYEADDIAGSLAVYCRHHGEVFLVTLDKDYMQLVDENVKIISLKKGDDYSVIDATGVVDYFGVEPHQVIDFLALVGDKSDNIPGVPGIGEKGASKLIHEFGSLEKILACTDDIKSPKLKEALKLYSEQAKLSKYLVTIKTDIPLNTDEFQLRYKFDDLKNHPEAHTMLQSLGMKGLLKNLTKSDSNEGLLEIKKTTSHFPHKSYRVIDKDYHSFLSSLLQHDEIVFDTETTGLDSMEDKPIGVSLSVKTGEAFYIPLIDHEKSSQLHVLQEERVLVFNQEAINALKDFFMTPFKSFIAHNLKFDLHMLENIGVTVSTGYCTMVLAWLLDPSRNEGFSLDALSLKELHLEKIPTSRLIGKGTGRESMCAVPLAELCEYACEDADATLRLWLLLKRGLEKNKELEKLYYETEMPLLKILLSMERTGVKIDSEKLAGLGQEMEFALNELEIAIFKIAGYEFKLTSPKQLGEALFDKVKVHEALGITSKLAMTTLGYKTDASVLEKYEEHPMVQAVQNHRELSKLLSTYVRVLPKLVKQSTGRLHTSFHQIGTATGRLSSSNPNLQNIPIRSEWGKKIRSIFIPFEEGDVLLSADYSQIELRVLCGLSHDQNMSNAFLSSTDFHKKTASQILEKPESEVTQEERSQAKSINFGIVYGMGPQKLARDQKIPLSRAKEFIEKYFSHFKGVKKYLDDGREHAKITGVARTYFGRVRPIPYIHSTDSFLLNSALNIAVNSPIQGTAADIVKMGMIKLFKLLEKNKLKTKIILQVHDELVLNTPYEEQEIVKELTREALEHAVSFSAPLKVEIGSGENWLEAH